jgi:hypothetical protein
MRYAETGRIVDSRTVGSFSRFFERQSFFSSILQDVLIPIPTYLVPAQTKIFVKLSTQNVFHPGKGTDTHTCLQTQHKNN